MSQYKVIIKEEAQADLKNLTIELKKHNELSKSYGFPWRIEIKRLSLHTESTSEACSPSSENSLEANGRFISSILLRSFFMSMGVKA